jgi:hypothetical protein
MAKTFPSYQCPICKKIWVRVMSPSDAVPTCPVDGSQLGQIQIDSDQLIALIQAAQAG